MKVWLVSDGGDATLAQRWLDDLDRATTARALARLEWLAERGFELLDHRDWLEPLSGTLYALRFRSGGVERAWLIDAPDAGLARVRGGALGRDLPAAASALAGDGGSERDPLESLRRDLLARDPELANALADARRELQRAAALRTRRVAAGRTAAELAARAGCSADDVAAFEAADAPEHGAQRYDALLRALS